MVSLKCFHCGREIEVSESARNLGLRCARCGKPFTAVVEDANKTQIGPPFAITPEAPPNDSATRRHDGEHDTVTPYSELPAETFTFLSPPRDANELGWLGHYRIVRMLGHGGMGIVFEAVDVDLERTVALKVMKPEVARDESARRRFLREARAMALVHSEQVTAIHQVGQWNDVPFMAMEFLQGESLETRLQRPGRPTTAETIRLGIDIAKGLEATHAHGLIHRDIKPGNIWLEAPDGHGKILDFGVARVVEDRSNLTQRGLLMGTPAYMAPEQIDGAEVDPRCDLFSLGCVLYEMATGKQAFTGASPMATLLAVTSKEPRPAQELNPDLPAALGALIARLLAKDPKGRPASAHEVIDTLQKIASGDSESTPRTRSANVKPNPVVVEFPAPKSESAQTAEIRQRYVLVAVLGAMSLVLWAGAAWEAYVRVPRTVRLLLEIEGFPRHVDPLALTILEHAGVALPILAVFAALTACWAGARWGRRVRFWAWCFVLVVLPMLIWAGLFLLEYCFVSTVQPGLIL